MSIEVNVTARVDWDTDEGMDSIVSDVRDLLEHQSFSPECIAIVLAVYEWSELSIDPKEIYKRYADLRPAIREAIGAVMS